MAQGLLNATATMRTSALTLLALIAPGCLLAVGCGGAVPGTRQTLAAPSSFTPIARATTAEPDGLRVLWNGGAAPEQYGAWIASTPSELESLWQRVGAAGPLPEVDLRSHVVLGVSFTNGVCMNEIVAAEVDAAGTLLLRTEPLVDTCILLLVSDARVIAVPRRILPEQITWHAIDDEASAFSFRVPAPSPDAARIEPASIASTERDHVAAPLGVVALPPPGSLALRSLDDGREVWVAQLPSGAVHVVAADAISEDDWLRHPVRWDAARGRFGTEHDVTGRSVHGGVPLETHAFARIDGDRIAVGEVIAIAARGVVIARSDAPALEGDATPYASLPVIDRQTLEAVPEGYLARVGADLVVGLEGPPRLCLLPDDPKLRRHFEGCSESALEVHGAPSEERGGISVVHGPLLVRRRGDALDLAIAEDGGLSSWTVEHRIEDAAREGTTRDRGMIGVGSEASGDTRGAADGFDAPCVAAGGSPDESFTFVAPADGPYAFEVEGDFDVALALLDSEGAVAACNDDRHGFYRASVAEATLTRGQHVRVVIDGFGGAAGSYRLQARRLAALDRGGVITLGVPVSGDTSGATDDRSAGCHAPARDDAWRLEVPEPGRYVVHVEADGWQPLLAAYAEGAQLPEECGVGPANRDEDFHLGAGTWLLVVDGAREEDVGRYRLVVERAE